MSADQGDKKLDLSRRKILLATTALAAASALGSAAPVSVAQAQQPASGKQPNILVIMATTSAGSTSAPITRA